jgi:hypothetical protein
MVHCFTASEGKTVAALKSVRGAVSACIYGILRFLLKPVDKGGEVLPLKRGRKVRGTSE